MKKYSLWLITCIFLLAASRVGFAAIASDPTRISQGARVLGMGKAFIALSDDVNAIFMNPAGLASITNWQVTSMTGKLLEEFNYVTLSGIYPTAYGQVGLAFSGASVGDAYATKVKSGTEGTSDPIYEFDYSLTPISYFNNVLVLSYANKAHSLLGLTPLKDWNQRLPYLSNLEMGGSVKFFSTGLSGADISGANGSGNELDLGIKYNLNDLFAFGVVLENLLPASMGGKLLYGSGEEEGYPMQLEAGVAIKILGKPGKAFREFMGQKLDLALDLDTYPTRTGYPYIYHLGLEWIPMDLITLRLGLDQDASEDESGNITSVSNLTAGVGLSYRDFRFDYGYHEFAGAPGITNSFFSLTYGIPWEQPKVNYVTVLKPQDATVTKEAVSVFAGVTDILARYVSIKGSFTPLKKDGSFEKPVLLELAKNRVSVEAFDVRRNLLESESVRLCRLITFPDVPSDYWAADQISYIGTLGIIKGYPDGKFASAGNITRAEMAAILIRTAKTATEEIKASAFKDVDLKHWAIQFVQNANKLGIVKGYPDKSFRPKANITRAEGLAMIARFAGISEEAYRDQFPDVDDSHWAAKTISGAYRSGILKYLERNMFDPNRKLTRAEAVEMLYRTKYVQDILKNDLLNWESY